MVEPIPLQLFSDCAAALKTDEMIRSDRFESKMALSAADFSGKRVDAYKLGEGHITYEEVLARLGPVPNENATPEEVLGICGKFVDLQASRVEGQTPLTNIFTTIYMQKEFEIKHPVLKFMFKVFRYASKRIERFAQSMLPGKSGTYYWFLMDSVMFDELEEMNEDELKAEMESLKLDPVLEGLAKFEFALAEFLENPREREMVGEFVAPETSLDVGYDMYMRYRDASPTYTPHWPQVPSHDVAVARMKQLVAELVEVKKVFKEACPIIELIELIAKWNEAKEYVPLTRLVAIYLVMGTAEDRKMFGQMDMKTYFEEELKQHHIPAHKFFVAKGYPEFEGFVEKILGDVFMKLLGPIPVAHKFLYNGLRFWGYVQAQGYSIFQETCKGECPRCKSKDHQRVASMVYPLWSTKIAARLLWIMFKWGDKAEIYSERDIPAITYILEVVLQTLALSYENGRIADAVYNSRAGKSKAQPRKEADVHRCLVAAGQNERLAMLQSDVMGCCMTLEKVLAGWNNLEMHKGQFFDEKGLFESRCASMSKLLHFQLPHYEEFCENMKLSKTHCGIIAKELVAKFASVKTRLMAYIKETKDQGPEVKEMMACLLMNSAILPGLSESNKYRLVKGSSVIFPRFELIKQ